MKFFITLLISLLCTAVLFAQRKPAKPKFDQKKNAAEQKELAAKAKATREDLIDASKKYKESLENLLVPLNEQQQIWQGKKNKTEKMIAEGLLAKRDIEPIETELTDLASKIDDTKKKITQAEQFMVEIINLELMARAQPNPKNLAPNVYFDNTRYIRYTGAVRFSLQDYSRIENFFQANYRRGLPVSAFGQSDTHNRLGFDHSNSFDVALHPDTAEARTLMAYLRNQGIPFTAFRGAIPGNATGAHIHIGYPSHRFR